jgi:hypothetical protein
VTLETLLLLQRCLHGQQLTVGDPSFPETAAAVLRALEELDRAIADAERGTPT